MYKPILTLLLLSFSAYAQSQSVWTSASECDGWSNVIRNAPSKSGACSVLSDNISVLKKANSSANNQYCLSKFESLKYELCGVTASAKNPSKSAPASKEQIYVFLFRIAGDREVFVQLDRQQTFEAAEANTFQGPTHARWEYFKRLDEDRCKKGFYVLGMNNIDESGGDRPGGRPVSGFLNCGYKSLDDAIDRGTREFPIPFFNVVIGDVAAKNESNYSLACGYDPRTRSWTRPAYLGNRNYGNMVDNLAACRALNARYPILVDRAPEQTIWVSPR